ncbi:MAG: DUF4279 domain-containing protein [Candidatus Obscuribacterales bacterium]|nr:DUF4279 domain-containing protein [Candidatus Obscuribacterales bacterium]
MVNAQVRLIFVGDLIDPDYITQTLGITPTKVMKEGEKFGSWKYDGLAISDDEASSGSYEAWRLLLLKNSEPLIKLKELGYDGYIEIEWQTDGHPTNDSLYLTGEFVQEIGRVGLGLSVWFKR